MYFRPIRLLIPVPWLLYPNLFPLTPNLSRLPDSILTTQITFPPSGDRGAPKTTSGGGTRGDMPNCITQREGEAPLAAIMPNRENFAKTATSTPVIYVYVPNTIAIMGEFVIIDQHRKEVYHTLFALPKIAGIIKLKIPPEANLKTGNIYNWSFMVICDSKYRYRDKYIEGQIEMIKMPEIAKQQLKNASPLEKAKVYATLELWFETLDTVAQLQTENPQAWMTLLQSVGLESLVEKSLIPCCLAE